MSSHNEQSGNLVCSFCGRSQNEVRKLIAGPTVFICDDCVYLSLSIISRDQINLRVAYFSFEFVAKLLFQFARLAERLRIVRNPN